MLRLPTLAAFIPTPTTARDPKIAPSVPRTIFENNLVRYNSIFRIGSNYVILFHKKNIYLTPASDPNISLIVVAYPCFSLISFDAMASGNSAAC